MCAPNATRNPHANVSAWEQVLNLVARSFIGHYDLIVISD